MKIEQIVKIKGMSCAHCVANVDKAITAVSGVSSVVINLKKAEAIVSGEYDLDEVIKAITEAGYIV